jgi:putative membrane protein
MTAATAILGSVTYLADCWQHGWGWHLFLAPLFWILLIVGVVWLIRGRPPWRRRRGPHRESAVETLERRFAQGEIEPDEYQRRRSILEGPRRE